MIFLVTVVMCRGIISMMMFHTGSPVLRTEVKKKTQKSHRERHASAMQAQQLVHVTSGRDHRQRLQQHREPGTHPADGPGLHRAGRAAHKVG